MDGADERNPSKVDGPRPRLAQVYQRIDMEYMPGEYPGKVTLFWTEDETETPREAAKWWRMIAGSVEVHILPGGHHEGALNAHPEVVARMLKSCIDTAESRGVVS